MKTPNRTPPFLRTAYNYDMNDAGNESGLRCTDPTLAKQSFKDECDINKIVERFGLTGELPTNIAVPEYQDFTQIYDYHSALNAVAQANEAFEELPAKMRQRFQNDPETFVNFCTDPRNREELTRMGLLKPEDQLPLPVVPEVPPAPPKPGKQAQDEPKPDKVDPKKGTT